MTNDIQKTYKRHTNGEQMTYKRHTNNYKQAKEKEQLQKLLFSYFFQLYSYMFSLKLSII